MKQAAVEALEAALVAVGLSATQPHPDSMRADLVVDTPAAGSVEVEVFATSIATGEDVDRMAHWRGEGVVRSWSPRRCRTRCGATWTSAPSAGSIDAVTSGWSSRICWSTRTCPSRPSWRRNDSLRFVA